MNTSPKRDEIRETAYEWCIKNLPQFFDCLNNTRSGEDVDAEYHGMVDGIVWPDEVPKESSVDLPTLRKIFCVLVHMRTSQILGETIPQAGLELITMIREKCPNWCFNKPDRWTTSLRNEYQRLRSRYFSDLDQIRNQLDSNSKPDF